MANEFVSSTKIQQAYSALQKCLENKKPTDLLGALAENEPIFLQVICKTISKKSKTIQIKLPHTLLEEKSDVCLFVKDIAKTKGDRESEPSKKHFVEYLGQRGIKDVTEVMPLKQLKLEYMAYEAKRALCSRFHVFLSDERILRLLPRLLGKDFYERAKMPRAVNLTAKDPALEFKEVLSSTYLYMNGRGSTSTVAVGHTGMTTEQLRENVQCACARLSEALPAGLANLRLLNLKTERSPSLPLYLDSGDAKSVQLPKSKKQELMCDAEELDTVMGAKVAVTAEGEVIVIDKRSNTITQRVKQAKQKIQRTKRYQQYLEKRKAVKVAAVKPQPVIKAAADKSLLTAHRRERKLQQKGKKRAALSDKPVTQPKQPKSLRKTKDAGKLRKPIGALKSVQPLKGAPKSTLKAKRDQNSAPKPKKALKPTPK